MLKIFMYILCSVNLVMLVKAASFASEDSVEEAEEVEASKCSEEYENCGYEIKYVNVTDPTFANATAEYDEPQRRTIKVHGHCCPGLVCKHEGYEEEPLPPGVDHFCADPDIDLNRERMFDKWKKSLEMPPNYSY